MNQDFSPGGFGRALGYPPNFVAPLPPPLTREEIERERYIRETRYATVRVSEMVLEGDGQTCLSRLNSRGETIFDVPVKRLNEKLNGKRIDLGDGWAFTVRFAQFSERVG